MNTEKRMNLRAASAEEALIALMILNPDCASYISENLAPELFVTEFDRRIYEILRGRVKNKEEITMADISGQFSQEEMSSVARMLTSHPRENDPAAAAREYMDVLKEESEKLTPEQIANADNDTIMEKLRKMKEKKQ